MIQFRTAVVIGSAALLLGACSTDTPETEPSATSITSSWPSLAVSVPPPPTQHNNGRQDVMFDPCGEISDDVVSRAGFDPVTRKRSDFIFDSYSFTGCSFDHKEQVGGRLLAVRNLTVSATNVTIDEFRTGKERTPPRSR